MSLPSFYLRRRRRQSGVALVLVLSFVVLLTIVMLFFLSRAMTARQLSSGSLKQSSADQLAVSALDVVTGNLKQEIASPANSSATPYPSMASPIYTVYRPLGATNVPPIRFGNPAFTSPSPDPAPNLVRISSRSDSGQNFPSSLASAVNSTTDVSSNGRSVTLARWNSHYLLPLNNTATASTNSAPVSSFVAPDWVLVTDTGGPAVLTAPSPSVIGRYAYAIYDEGGLLDVNVAGYPSQSPISQYGDKPAVAYADLTQLALPSAPTQSLLSTSDVDNLVGWRNYASVQPSGTFGSFTMTTTTQLQNFFNLITGNTAGFLTVNPATWNNLTDQAFLSRQQLLKFRASEGFNANALQYLGTFSRDLNAPSWAPTFDASAEGGNNGSGSPAPFAYKTNAQTQTITNPLTGGTESNPNLDVLGVRVTTSFIRADGTTAQVGEPLVKYRFPLNRLQGITYQGIDTTDNTTLINGVLSPATAATIQRDFGLVWVPADGSGNPVQPGQPTDLQSAPHWNYCGPTGTAIQSSIATLGSIGNREPNFFELLKAAILNGSLGRDAGLNGEYLVNYERGPASGIQTSDQNVDFQVIQLGANILNQAAPENYPREIHFADPNNGNAETAFYGIANLPYLQRVFAKTASTTDSNNVQNGALGWYMAELWNPHQNFGYGNSSLIPTNFRFCGDGFSAMFIPSYANQQKDNPSWPVPNNPPNSSSQDLTKSGYIQFTVPWSSTSTFCREPTLLSIDGGNTPSFVNNPPTVVTGSNGGPDTYYSGSVEGLYSGYIQIFSDDPNGGSAGIQPQGCNLYLEYSPDGGTTWRIYDKMRNLTGEHDWNPWILCFYYQHVDPRTDRIGTSLGMWTYGTPANPSANPPTPAIPLAHPPGQSIRQNRGTGWWSYDYFPCVSAGFNYTTGNADSQVMSEWDPAKNPNPTSFFMGTLSDNLINVPTDASNALPSQTSYADPDGITRPAEGAYASALSGDPQGDARPLFPTTSPTASPPGLGESNNRPIILNRPFRNVGELGYAFRDLPWKNIDFFTSSTGDAGLLDFFCINESTTTTPMVAGTVNLNTRQAPVLQAIIANAIKNEVTPSGSGTIPGLPTASSEAAAIATNIVNWTQSSSSTEGPFQYRGDLLTKAASTLVASSATSADQEIKIRREAALRALSDVGTARTWTLMVDLVAQVGHYPPGATTLKQFVVDGEKRYWLHIAIDRYTGQVVDRVLEPVYE